QAAVLSSVNAGNVAAVLAGVLQGGRPPARLLTQLLTVAVALDDRKGLPAVLRELTDLRDDSPPPGSMAALAAVFGALERQGRSLDTVADADTRARVGRLIERARAVAADPTAPEAHRLAPAQF